MSSFEFFPPKDEAGVEQLFRTVAELTEQTPAYVSVTYGAGGSTRRLTVDLVRRIKAETGIEAMAHLTCVGMTKDELAQVLEQLAEAKIDNILALRGDPPKGSSEFVAPKGGFVHAEELVAYIRERFPEICIGVAGYPERHPEAKDFASDLLALKGKCDAGADFVVTQLFFDDRDFLAYVERARALGIEAPIVPGIMPITNVSQIKRFTAMCGAHVPARLLAQLEAVQDNPDAVRAMGVAHAVEQCERLLRSGVPAIHLYTLNRSTASLEILRTLNAKGWKTPAAHSDS
ncbi:MAG: methylenetetrahydrofolate reductase [NAD(P)H] [Polyangiaceae bacterium]